jgi:ABC-type lipoprotein release transport system permease subunit
MQPQQMYQPTYSTPPNPLKKIVIGVVVVVVVMVLALIVVMVSSGGSATGQLGTPLARQNNLVTLLDEHGEKARSVEATSFVARAKIILSSLSLEMTEAGIISSKSQVADVQVPGINEQLEQAARNNQFDEIFLDYARGVISSNQQDVATFIQDVEPGSAVEAVLQRALAAYESLL